ncbi:MAG: acyl-ACP--UDP-N-acetylglucosamine O-acyltransferase [Pseudolabrys sp.]|nr:acyl-ACP--UDP-N-acetylglucosamine O-acyltransferase [Pseudolabrys sp.]
MSTIDPTARVDAGAVLGRNVSIGPYCIVGPNVQIGDDCRLDSHVNLAGHTTIGPRTTISPFASLGTPPQSVHYQGEPSKLIVGADCIIREHVTMNIGTGKGNGQTVIGDHCFLMVGSHVGHDCIVGSHVTFANNATLGGFCEIGDYAFLGGLCAVHQFVRIGAQAMIGGLAGVSFDVIPYGMAFGNHAVLAGINKVGLKRRGLSPEALRSVYRGYRAIFYGGGTMSARVEKAATEYRDNSHVMHMVEFIRSAQKRRLTVPRARNAGADVD